MSRFSATAAANHAPGLGSATAQRALGGSQAPPTLSILSVGTRLKSLGLLFEKPDAGTVNATVSLDTWRRKSSLVEVPSLAQMVEMGEIRKFLYIVSLS